jgi:glycosyltransferase involved in cell wall biosynthesis
MLTVVSVGYPFACVIEDSAGGAEQILAHLDCALVKAGHRSIVIAPEGSRTAGELRPVPAVEGMIDDHARAHLHAQVRGAIEVAITRERVDLVHCHGIDFAAYAVQAGCPSLATLHLPIDWYDALPDWVQLVPVSASQSRTAPPDLALLPPITNGVDLELYRPAGRKGGYVLAIGRVAPEKGFHDAIAAAKRADVELRLAGALYAYPEHQRYFQDEVGPTLDARRRWVGPVAGADKRRLIAEATCLLVPSTAPETSSLVAMEALASGTPVIAYRSGALPEVVEHGVTGFIVDDVQDMAEAIGRVGSIDLTACRAAAEARFSARRMTAEYLALYERLAA